MKKFFLVITSAIITIIIILLLVNLNKTARLEVDTSPDGANIKIGIKSYKSPVSIKVAPGRYTIEATKDGYVEQIKTVEVDSSKKNTVKITLPSEKTIEPVQPINTPAAIGQLPIRTDKYMIEWLNDDYSILVTPNFSFDAKTDPYEYFANHWDQYQKAGQEALGWLEKNGLGKDVRTNQKINIKWWGEEYWPADRSIES